MIPKNCFRCINSGKAFIQEEDSYSPNNFFLSELHNNELRNNLVIAYTVTELKSPKNKKKGGRGLFLASPVRWKQERLNSYSSAPCSGKSVPQCILIQFFRFSFLSLHLLLHFIIHLLLLLHISSVISLTLFF